MKKKMLVGVCAALCVILAVLALVIILDDKSSGHKISGGGDKELVGVEDITLNRDIQALKDGKYSNLIYHEFETSISDVVEVYNLEIRLDKSYENRTNLENFYTMGDVVDKFFGEGFDKSYTTVDFYVGDETVCVDYNDMENVCEDDKYNTEHHMGFMFGDSETGFVQITKQLVNVWFSKHSLGSTLPDYTTVYHYVDGIRQIDDIDVKLKDTTVKLSEMEARVLDYVNNNLPLPCSEGISYGIGKVGIVDNHGNHGVGFTLRRIYKGIPFEYGYVGASGQFIDEFKHDRATIMYADSTNPDILMGFGYTNGTIVETKRITNMLALDDALGIVSKKIGTNSVYDVYGIELVYRAVELSEEQEAELEGIYTPRWKIITVNQNDDKYTLFYVDVVTGELTERFEYYDD